MNLKAPSIDWHLIELRTPSKSYPTGMCSPGLPHVHHLSLPSDRISAAELPIIAGFLMVSQKQILTSEELQQHGTHTKALLAQLI